MIRPAPILGLGCLLAAGIAHADPPRVVAAKAVQGADGRWMISVTLKHADTGWDHYASGWKILAPDGAELGYRELTHPHVEEQPFERSLEGVTIPTDLREILIVPRCTMDGWVAMPTILTLPAP